MGRRLVYAILVLLLTLCVATFGYRFFLGDSVSLFDCFYMTIITLSTVGYGEVIDLSNNVPARIFTIFIIFIGGYLFYKELFLLYTRFFNKVLLLCIL